MAGVTLLDGGIGQEMVARAGDRPTPLWSTRAMMDHPGLLQQIHADYFAAGADIATTNTYAIHRDRLRPDGLEEAFAPLMAAALGEASAARAAHGRGRIAGSIGPLRASYRPDLHPPHAEAVPLYAEVARLLAPRVDLILVETVASVAHARAALEGAVAAGRPVWLAVTLDDEDGTRLRSGESLAEVLPVVTEGGAAAVLANCSAPEAMPAGLDILARAGLPFGAYANGFARITKAFLQDRPTVDALSPRRDLGPVAYADHAMGWVGQGATILGGCCETGPAHIAEIARRLREAGLHD
ncbi:homocysteine S-methyltransferase family protein [Roseicyclus persicicus]|uniref:Homocysteine S-methyltransferase family protein n=1 Tax=Roseicyclus persicicus TaxID=2650661 RepID=A0A7X6GYQ2_9RHOB|nr:homocysteine S-methyltransferase family protein [Roseibacterium persicicum]NKX44837.1 homocysteine S-methyltransferase family protein [Roseibacterium persicicum]